MSLSLHSNGSFDIQLEQQSFLAAQISTAIDHEEPQAWSLVEQSGDPQQGRASFRHPQRSDITSTFQWKCHAQHLTLQRSIHNNSSSDVLITHASDFSGVKIQLSSDAEIYSTENACISFLKLCWDSSQDENIPQERPQEFGTYVNGSRYNESLKGRSFRYGKAENQPFTAQSIHQPQTNTWITLGQLTHRYADISSHYDGQNSDAAEISLLVSTEHFFRGQQGYLLKAGQSFEGEMLFLGVNKADELTVATQDYRDALTPHLNQRSRSDRLKVFEQGRVWGSWNLGLFRDISHELILDQAQRIREQRPDLKWIQVDDGYNVATKPGLFILEDPGIDEQKFPKGMKAFCEDIKALDLKPALWMGLIINPETHIPDFAKDWLLLKKDGQPLELPEGNKFLDFSLEEVRAYFEKIIRTVTQEWGFQGFKFDFWSDHFHCVDAAYRNPEFTGSMLRDWFWKTLRSYVGPEGFLLTCCCVGSGNPFIGQYADSYRCGIDIGEGHDWHGQVSSAFWYGIQAKLKVSDFILPNIDSMGDFTQIVSENMYRCWTSFAALSGAHMEYGGLLQKEHANWGPKTVEAFNWVPLGQMPEPIDFPQPRQGHLAPMLWLNASADGTCFYLAVCNWSSSEASQAMSFDLSVLPSPPQEIIEFWEQTELECSGQELMIPSIPACDAKVFIIKT